VTFDHFRQLPGGLTVDDLSRCIRRHEIGGGAE
jgi:hypothetical protein